MGLAIARLLSTRFPEKSTYLVERNGRAGEETRYVSCVQITIVSLITSIALVIPK